MAPKKQSYVKDCMLVLLGFVCTAPLLLLPQPASFPRAEWHDASHMHSSDSSSSTSALAAAPVGTRIAAEVAAVPRTPPRLHHVCKDTDPVPPASGFKYDIMGRPGSSTDRWEAATCHWAPLRHPGVPLRPFNVCTHDPSVDKVISRFLHEYNFWDSPETYNTLLAAGPCTEERPYMLDIGANLGLWTLVSVAHGCRAVSFEPLSQNILRLKQSLAAMGKADNAILYKHAAGKRYGEVSISFFAGNPGASAIGGAGANKETVGILAVDGVLLGDPEQAPKFKTPPGTPPLPPVIGRHIAWAKIDTEGWDVAVLDGAMRTLIGGRVPILMIEFTPQDAVGVAGCDPVKAIQVLYANGYRMYKEGGDAARLHSLTKREVPRAAAAVGARVFEVLFIHDEAAVGLIQKGILKPFMPQTEAEAQDAVVVPWSKEEEALEKAKTAERTKEQEAAKAKGGA